MLIVLESVATPGPITTTCAPTILELAGLKDDCVHDGRAISEILQGYAVPRLWRKARSSSLSRKCTEQLNAPFGAFAMATLTSSSMELASSDTNDGTYNS